MELGKDVLAIAPDGIPCAYQLKRGDISLSDWRNNISQQVQDLVQGRIVHPSIDASQQHRAYLVTSGKIEEETIRAIDDMNRAWQTRGQPQLHVIVKGELLSKAKQLRSDLWPTELQDMKTLLELFLEDGREIFPKAKFANLLESTLPLETDKTGKKPGQPKCSRAISSAAILTSIALSSFSGEKNFAAEIDVWTLYVSYVLALAERWSLPPRVYQSEINIALLHIKNSLGNLVHEVRGNRFLLEGNAFVDEPFRRIRITWLLSLISIYALWSHSDEDSQEDINEFTRVFCTEHFSDLYLWGEAAVPQILAYYWYLRTTDATVKTVSLLISLIRGICQRNKEGNPNPLPDPHFEAAGLLPYMIDYHISGYLPHVFRLADEPLDMSFNGRSAALEGLVHIFARQNWKQTMKELWPDITRIAFTTFDFAESWQFFRWRNQKGTNRETFPAHTQDWSELKLIASESEGADISSGMKKYPILVLLFLCVFPHRMSACVLRWLDSEMTSLCR
jgi:hypothetical protein